MYGWSLCLHFGHSYAILMYLITLSCAGIYCISSLTTSFPSILSLALHCLQKSASSFTWYSISSTSRSFKSVCLARHFRGERRPLSFLIGSAMRASADISASLKIDICSLFPSDFGVCSLDGAYFSRRISMRSSVRFSIF